MTCGQGSWHNKSKLDHSIKICGCQSFVHQFDKSETCGCNDNPFVDAVVIPHLAP